MPQNLTTDWLRRLLNSEPPSDLENELREQHASAIAWLYEELTYLREGKNSVEDMWDTLLWCSLSFNHLEAHLADREKACASILAALAKVDQDSRGLGRGGGYGKRTGSEKLQFVRHSCTAVFSWLARFPIRLRPQGTGMNRFRSDDHRYCVARPVLPQRLETVPRASPVEPIDHHGEIGGQRTVASARLRADERVVWG